MVKTYRLIRIRHGRPRSAAKNQDFLFLSKHYGEIWQNLADILQHFAEIKDNPCRNLAELARIVTEILQHFSGNKKQPLFRTALYDFYNIRPLDFPVGQ